MGNNKVRKMIKSMAKLQITKVEGAESGKSKHKHDYSVKVIIDKVLVEHQIEKHSLYALGRRCSKCNKLVVDETLCWNTSENRSMSLEEVQKTYGNLPIVRVLTSHKHLIGL